MLNLNIIKIKAITLTVVEVEVFVEVEEIKDNVEVVGVIDNLVLEEEGMVVVDSLLAEVTIAVIIMTESINELLALRMLTRITMKKDLKMTIVLINMVMMT